MFKTVGRKSTAKIAAEWDALAPLRFHQIVSGEDLTFKYVMAPIITKLVRAERPKILIDAGCGVGVLSRRLKRHVPEVIGIDPSHESISIARNHYQSEGINFVASTLETFSNKTDRMADVLIANMVLMDVINLNKFIGAAKKTLRPQGALIFSITHPWFWPFYYGYANEKWFRYERETIIESPFRISNSPRGELASTHIHRPLESYLRAFHIAGLTIEELWEPMPSASTMKLYPKKWSFPRYLIGVGRRKTSST